MRSYRRRDQAEKITGDTQDGSDRGAGTGLGHGLGIVRDPLVQQLQSRGTRTVHPIGWGRRGKFHPDLGRFEFLRSTTGGEHETILSVVLVSVRLSCTRRARILIDVVTLFRP